MLPSVESTITETESAPLANAEVQEEGGEEDLPCPRGAEQSRQSNPTATTSTPTTDGGVEWLSVAPLSRAMDAPVKARTYFMDVESKRFYPAVLRGFFS